MLRPAWSGCTSYRTTDFRAGSPRSWAGCRIWSTYTSSRERPFGCDSAGTGRPVESGSSWASSRTTLSGEIPPELGDLSNLVSTETCGRNELTGPIPPELGDLSNLERSVRLYQNALSGAIPPELGGPVGPAVSCNSTTNELSGAIPPELGDLARLQVHGPLRPKRSFGPDSSGVGRSCQLGAVMRLAQNSLSGPIPAHVRRTGEPDLPPAVAQPGVGRSHAGGPEESGAGVAYGERHGALRAAGAGVRGVAPDHPQTADRGVRGASGGVPGAGGAVARAPGSACGGRGRVAARLRHGGDGDDRGDS